MKKCLLLPVLFLLFSCETEGELTQSNLNPITVTPENAVLKYSGVFSPTSGITVAGGVTIYLDTNQYKLKLENFSVSDGPDLKVYLSKSNTPTEFVNLGNLNPTTVYSIPESVDVSSYKYVLIHCQEYNHLFAVAELSKK